VKALPLEQPTEYHGGSYFYSPTKVQKARDLLRQQELAEEQTTTLKGRESTCTRESEAGQASGSSTEERSEGSRSDSM
jgi:hypothetical protein